MHRLGRRQSRGSRSVAIGSALALVVIGWWLLLGGAVLWLIPREASATPSIPFAAIPGQAARIHQPGMPSRSILASRLGLDRFQHRIRQSDEQPIEDAFTASEWITISHGLAVRIAAIDGVTAQVELLEGTYVGHLAWLEMRDLAPPR